MGLAARAVPAAPGPPQRRRHAQGDWGAGGAERAGSLEEALELLEGVPQVFVIGGAELYAAALPLADELLLTEIDADVEGDRFFPAFERGDFDEVAREAHVSEDGTRFSFVTYVRRGVR